MPIKVFYVIIIGVSLGHLLHTHKNVNCLEFIVIEYCDI